MVAQELRRFVPCGEYCALQREAPAIGELLGTLSLLATLDEPADDPDAPFPSVTVDPSPQHSLAAADAADIASPLRPTLRLARVHDRIALLDLHHDRAMLLSEDSSLVLEELRRHGGDVAAVARGLLARGLQASPGAIIEFAAMHRMLK